MHLIFDLDGTLADTHPGIADAFRSAMAEVLPDTVVPDFARHIGPPVRQVFQKALDCEDQDILDALNAAFRIHYDGGCWKNSRPYPGVPELLEYLQESGMGCSVLTNKPALPTGRILEHLQLRPYFSHVISPDSVSPGFPNKAEAAVHLLNLIRNDPTTTWIIGDSIDDAAAAAASGSRFAAAAYGYGNAHLQTRYPIHLRIDGIPQFHSHLQNCL